jgi:hypothetical protein
LRADLRICADSAGIIVGGSRNQTGAETRENFFEEIAARVPQFIGLVEGICFGQVKLRLKERLDV